MAGRLQTETCRHRGAVRGSMREMAVEVRQEAARTGMPFWARVRVKLNDHFYTGQRVPISLGYFGFPEKLAVRVKALKQDDKVFLEKLPEFTEGRACSLDGVEVTEELR